jgi:23S rRNA (uracil1939-C5)-methyltransferase
MEEVNIEKLVHGGQGLGALESGQKVFVWNALPGETVRVRVIKKKKSYIEAIAEEVVVASPERIAPQEENYLATSPWQMMTYGTENKFKRQIVEDLFVHEKITLPEFSDTIHEDEEWHYRNKMEYSFWGDDDGLHLALYRRGSHGKQIVAGSKLALPAIDAAANAVLTELQKLNVRAGHLKTIVVRCNQKGEAVASLFVKPRVFPKITLPKELKGLRVYHSNPKSPASVPTALIYELGTVLLEDTLLGKSFVYDVDSFFQVNIPIFEKVLQIIKDHNKEPKITDMYAGTGSIGLSVAEKSVDLIELDAASAKMADINASKSGLEVTVYETSAEKALDYITSDVPVIFDPPRAGLHGKVVEQVLEALPPKITYLSCNPATQARDIALLQEKYIVEYFSVCNFFPRTPHIETLAILRRR